MASFDSAARAVRCARSIRDSVSRLGIAIRAGLHVGECEMRRADLTGLVVHIAARVGAAAGPGEVVVTRDVKALVEGSELIFDRTSPAKLKGIPGTWDLFVLAG